MINAALESGEIGFETGSANFRRADAQALDALAMGARACVAGNALELAVKDDVLARARADAMAGFLERAGLPRPRIAAIGYGPAEGGRGMDTGAAAASDRPFEFTVREQSGQWPG
jgi:OOP family OmpA-OmpF porin